jgi:formate dehydrogenase subunit gamma
LAHTMQFGIDIFRFNRRLGEEVVVGLTWDVLLIFAFVAALVFLVHFVVREILNPTGHTIGDDEPGVEEVQSDLEAQGIEEVERFTLTQRVGHWVMAISIFLLMLSGFIIMNTDVTINALPGVSWLALHELTGIILIGYTVFHVGHVAAKGTWMKMWFSRNDLEDQLVRVKNFFGLTEEYPRQFEYPGAQKMLHAGVTAATLGLIVTGLVLLRRLNFVGLWEATREFSFLGIDFTLGQAGSLGLISWSFVVHDFLAIGMVALVMGHVYFALRPQEWGITRSMITGNVPTELYAEKYDPRSWTVGNPSAADGGQPDDESAEADD